MTLRKALVHAYLITAVLVTNNVLFIHFKKLENKQFMYTWVTTKKTRIDSIVYLLCLGDYKYATFNTRITYKQYAYLIAMGVDQRPYLLTR